MLRHLATYCGDLYCWDIVAADGSVRSFSIWDAADCSAAALLDVGLLALVLHLFIGVVKAGQQGRGIPAAATNFLDL